MDEKTQAKYQLRATIAKAMAHPTRLFIIDQLAQKENCVRELTGMVGADMSTVSRHLAILKDAGLIQDQKRGNQVFYRLRCQCIMSFFDCIETVLRDTAQEQLELIK